jgi:hypothetical protein
MSRYAQVERKVRVDEIRPGDVVDLECDIYADPAKVRNGLLAMQYMTVVEIEREGAGCIVLYFDENNPVGFPPDHLIHVATHDTQFDNEEVQS